MKTLFTLLATALLLSILVSGHSRTRSEGTRGFRRVAGRTVALVAAPTVRRLAQSSAAGHVADVMVWSSSHVLKGQPLVRLSIPVSTPALRQAQQALAAAKAAYESAPNADKYRALEQARTRLAEVPRFERNAYVVAPATGWLVPSGLVNGQYLPRAATVAVIEVPVRAANNAPLPVAVR